MILRRSSVWASLWTAIDAAVVVVVAVGERVVMRSASPLASRLTLALHCRATRHCWSATGSHTTSRLTTLAPNAHAKRRRSSPCTSHTPPSAPLPLGIPHKLRDTGPSQIHSPPFAAQFSSPVMSSGHYEETKVIGYFCKIGSRSGALWGASGFSVSGQS
jgi:hypothetical protein